MPRQPKKQQEKRKWEGLEHKHIVTAGEAFAGRLKQVRERKGWTQARLAEELEKLDYRLDRVTISKIERGGARAQNVTLEEVLALAFALGVSPKHLVVPYSMEERLQVVPAERPSTTRVARRWIAGEDTLASEDPQFFFRELPPEELERVMEEARELRLGGRGTPEAFAMRQEMVEKGEAPPLVERDETKEEE
jgi:transcriptional regulator with XRE-family HTH domain